MERLLQKNIHMIEHKSDSQENCTQNSTKIKENQEKNLDISYVDGMERDVMQRKSTTQSYFNKLVEPSSSTYKAIPIPSGWNRILEKGAITYISPNKSRLRSMEDIKLYMLTPETCKCGLMCPLKAEETFSFNPSVPSIPMLKRKSSNSCANCEVSQSFERLLPCLTPEEVARLLKKSSKKKKKKSKGISDEGTKKKLKHKKTEQSLQNSFVEPMDMQQHSSVRQTFIPDSRSNKLSQKSKDSIENFNTSQTFDVDVAYSQINAGKMLEMGYHMDHIGYSSSAKSAKKSSLKRSSSTTQSHKSIAMDEQEFMQSIDPTQKPLNIVRPGVTAGTKSKNLSRNSAKKPRSANVVQKGLNVGTSRKTLTQSNTHDNRALKFPRKNAGKAALGLNAQSDGSKNSPHNHEELGKSAAHSPNTKIISSPKYSSNLINPSLNLLTSKAPPNITLPPSHSDVLPQALTQGISTKNENVQNLQPEEFYASISPGSSNSGASPIELEQCKKQEPDPFSHIQAKANVYWGSGIQTSAQETINNTSTGVTGAADSFKLTITKGANVETDHQHSNSKLSTTINADTQNALLPRTSSMRKTPSSKLIKSQLSTVNGSSDLCSKVETNLVNALASDSSLISFTQGKQQLTSSRASGMNQMHYLEASLPLQVSSNTSSKKSDLLSTSNNKSLTSSVSHNIPTSAIPVGAITEQNSNFLTQKVPKSRLSSERGSISSEEGTVHAANTQTVSNHGALNPSAVAVASSGTTTQNAQMVLFQFVSQSNNIKSSALTAVSSAQTSADQITTTSVPSFHNVYGNVNTTSIVRQPSSLYQSNISATNPAQFLIMGSQASQALQHLALQNSALQASMQHADTSQAMYTANALKAASQNVGFAYTNVPLQFLPIGGGQVIGKQSQNHPSSMEQFHSVYQYYQSNRMPESGKFDPNQQAVNQAATYLYSGLNQFSPALPNNYVRIAPASTIARPTIPGIAIPKYPIAPEAPKTDILLSSPGVAQKVNTDSNTPRDKASSVSQSKPNEKNKKTEVKRATKVNEPLKQEAIEKTSLKEQSPLEGLDKRVSTTENFFQDKTNQDSSQASTSTQDSITSMVNNPELENSVQTYQNYNSKNTVYCSGADGSKPGISFNDSKENAITESGKDSSMVNTKMSQHNSHNNEIEENTSQAVDAKKREIDDQEELSLVCHEDAASVDSRTPTPENSYLERPIDFRVLQAPINFPIQNSRILGTGDLIWGHQKGYSAWPGKIVNESEVGESRANEGFVWVKWFGEHTHSQIELSKLKVLSEGLRDLESNTRRRKNRGSKKVSESLEKAICEALLEVDESEKEYNIYKKYLENSSDSYLQSNKKIAR